MPAAARWWETDGSGRVGKFTVRLQKTWEQGKVLSSGLPFSNTNTFTLLLLLHCYCYWAPGEQDLGVRRPRELAAPGQPLRFLQ
jgi:hypothetical protein